MFEKTENVPTPATPSYLYGNLNKNVIHGELFVGFIHINDYIILCPTRGEPLVNRIQPKSGHPGNSLLQAFWTEEHGESNLFLITKHCIQVYEWDGSVLLCSYRLSTNSQHLLNHFTTGVSLGEGRICTGMTNGTLKFLYCMECEGTLAEEKSLCCFNSPIFSMTSHQNLIAISNSEGNIAIKQEIHKNIVDIATIESKNSPVSCMEILQDILVAGYLSGHIRLFRMDGSIMVEICSHGRSVTGLDVSKETGMFLTCSEDTFVKAWRLDTNSQSPVEHKFSAREKNALLTGARFSDESGCGFLVVAYDRRGLIQYEM